MLPIEFGSMENKGLSALEIHFLFFIPQGVLKRVPLVGD